MLGEVVGLLASLSALCKDVPADLATLAMARLQPDSSSSPEPPTAGWHLDRLPDVRAASSPEPERLGDEPMGPTEEEERAAGCNKVEAEEAKDESGSGGMAESSLPHHFSSIQVSYFCGIRDFSLVPNMT